VALHVLRALEDALIRNAQFDLTVRARAAIALYILNHKRAHLRELERRFGVQVLIEADESLAAGVSHALERGEPARGPSAAEAEPPPRPGYGVTPDEEDALEEAPEPEAEVTAEDDAEAPEDEEERGEAAEGSAEDAERRRRKRRRRRRGGERAPGDPDVADQPQPADDGLERVAEIGGDFQQPSVAAGEEGGRPNGVRRRRSRRGRRDRFAPRFGEGAPAEASEGEGEAEPALIHDDPAHGVAPPAAGMDEAPASIAEALETPLPVDPTPEAAVSPPAEGEPIAEAQDPAPEPDPVVEEPPRPRRTGWWQRAKSTLVGE